VINIAETTQNDKFMKFVGKNQTVFVIYIKNTIILKAAVVFFPCAFKGNIYLLINFVFICCKFEIFFFSFIFYFFLFFIFFGANY